MDIRSELSRKGVIQYGVELEAYKIIWTGSAIKSEAVRSRLFVCECVINSETG